MRKVHYIDVSQMSVDEVKKLIGRNPIKIGLIGWWFSETLHKLMSLFDS